MCFHVFPFSFHRLKAERDLVRDVYSAAKKLKMERVKQVSVMPLIYINRCFVFFLWGHAGYCNLFFQHYFSAVQICGDYLLSKIDCQSVIAYRNFASSMGDGRLLGKIDSYIQEHLMDISEKDDFLKLPRLKASLKENLNTVTESSVSATSHYTHLQVLKDRFPGWNSPD